MYTQATSFLCQDPVLKTIITQPLEITTAAPKDVYKSLLRSIVSQQLSTKAAATIHGRFIALFPQNNPLPQAVLDKSIEELRAVGLSKQKAGYMQNIAAFALEHQLDSIDWAQYSDQEIIKLLTQIKGVGTWTVQMMLMFTLQRPDVFPSADLGIQQAMQRLYHLEGKGKELLSKMQAIAAAWSPYRTTACRYLWLWKDQ